MLDKLKHMFEQYKGYIFDIITLQTSIGVISVSNVKVNILLIA